MNKLKEIERLQKENKRLRTIIKNLAKDYLFLLDAPQELSNKKLIE